MDNLKKPSQRALSLSTKQKNACDSKKSDIMMNLPPNPIQNDPNDQIRQYVIRYFKTLRLKQNQNRDITAITEDILFVIRFVNESVSQPVSELNLMGIVILKAGICFNLDTLSAHICITQKQKILSSLQRDGWRQATSEAYEALKQLIGENSIKNWIIFELPLPEKSEITQYVNENPRLFATASSISMQNIPLIPPHQMPSYFPLVSIQYERENAYFDIFDFDPKAAKAISLKKNLVLEKPQLLFVRDEYKPGK